MASTPGPVSVPTSSSARPAGGHQRAVERQRAGVDQRPAVADRVHPEERAVHRIDLPAGNVQHPAGPLVEAAHHVERRPLPTVSTPSAAGADDEVAADVEQAARALDVEVAAAAGEPPDHRVGRP